MARYECLLALSLIVVISFVREIEAKKNLTEICQDLPTDLNPRVKRQLPSFATISREMVKFFCYDGSFLSCLETLIRVVPMR